MPDVIETTDLVEPWLYKVLTTDAPLLTLVGGVDHISGTLSEQVLKPPYVTFLCQSTVDVTGVAGARISTDNLYIVKAVAASGSWDAVRPIARRLDELLHRPNQTITLTTPYAGSLTITRERLVQYPEVDDGIQYRHLGAIYRVRASADV